MFIWKLYDYAKVFFKQHIHYQNTGFGALNESNLKWDNNFTVFDVSWIYEFNFAVGIVIDVFTNGNFKRTFKERRMLYKIARLRRHFVLFYHNEYTAQVAKQFRENHIPFVVVDS